MIQKDFFPREFFLEVSQNLPVEGRPLWQMAWLLPPPHPAKHLHGLSPRGRGGGASESPTSSSVPSTIIVKNCEVDHSASPHLQASRQGKADIVKQERFQLDNRKDFLLPDS